MSGETNRNRQVAANASARRSGALAGTGATPPRAIGAPKRGRGTTPRSASIELTRFYLVPREWILMAPAIGGALAILAAISWSMPGGLSTAFVGLSLLLVASTPLAVRIERQFAQNLLQRYGVLAVTVGLSMFLFGLAIARWVQRTESVGWEAAIGVLVAIGALAGAMLHGRLPSNMIAQLSLWFGVSVIEARPANFGVLAFGAVVGLWLAIQQMRRARAEEAHQQEIGRAQQRAEELLAEYEEAGLGWFWETDRRGAITYVSPTIGQLLMRRTDDMLGRPLAELFILDVAGQEGERTLAFHLSARSSFQELAVRAATSGEERWWSISGRPVHDHYGNFLGFRGSGTDLTEKRRSQQNATRLAHYDSLTGLANRFQMSQTLEKILAAVRPEHRACAVMLIDLDRFKQVNDTMGHPTGDALLRQVAQRLESSVGEAGRVGRLGGDEFQVILPGHNARDDLAHLARRIIENLSQPYLIEDHRVTIGASVGISLSPDDGATSEALIRNADLALYAAKDGGRGRHHFYAEDLHSDAEERRRLEQDLRDAISRGGLELHYQPVVQTTTEKITGFEALIRWNHPVHGPISPSRFIPIAEDAGLIAPIGEWALRTACAELAKWPDSVRVAVNVSPLQFANPALPSIVTSATAAAQIEPSRLELEITEGVFLNDDQGTEAMFAALKRVGVRLALDDFGTGYSSLGYLKKAPFDKIKIDQSFVRGATMPGSRNGAIISSIVSLAESLGMETTAEGVETMDELDLVRMLGCSHVQGYIYERPLDAAGASERLKAGLVAVARGPRSARAPRQTMLRKVLLEHAGERYHATIRNISRTGVMVEGLWNVPAGTIFSVHMSDKSCVQAISRWCKEDRMGLEFAEPMPVDANGAVLVQPQPGRRPASESALLRKAG